jgi:hypothetical protein
LAENPTETPRPQNYRSPRHAVPPVLAFSDHQLSGIIRSDMSIVAFLGIVSIPLIAGAVLLFCPLAIYRMPTVSGYTPEFLNSFTTRVVARATGVGSMLFGIAVCSYGFRDQYPELPERLFAALLVLFGSFYVSVVVLGLVAWIGPKAMAWTERFSTDKITIRQHRIEIVIGVAVLLSSVAWAALPLVAP